MKVAFVISLLATALTGIAAPPQGALFVADYNGDGVNDYLVEDTNKNGRNTAYFVYLSDPHTGTHHKLDLDIANARWNSEDKTLTSCILGGGGRTYTTTVYRFSGLRAYPIKIETRTEKELDGDLVFTTTTKILVNGHWKIIVKHE